MAADRTPLAGKPPLGTACAAPIILYSPRFPSSCWDFRPGYALPRSLREQRLREAEGRQILAYYESVFIARQDISATQAETLADTFAKAVTDGGGKVAKREIWGLRQLAYRIKKNRKGHYILFNFDAPSAAIEEMERQMRLHEDVLRHMTIKVDEPEEGPSIIMRNRERGERGDRGDRNDRGGRGRYENKSTAKPAEATGAKTEDAVAKATAAKPADTPEAIKAGEAGEEAKASQTGESEGDQA